MSMSPRGAHKFDPAKADLLDSADRSTFLPDDVLVDLLDLTGTETVLDYGAGTGRVTLEVAAHLTSGRIIAVDESPEMVRRLRARTEGNEKIEVVPIAHNRTALPDASVDRLLAVNLLHEIRGETALAEMRRVLKPTGLLLAVDWAQDSPSDSGPPSDHRYRVGEAQQELEAAALHAEVVDVGLPYHFVLRCRPTAN